MCNDTRLAVRYIHSYIRDIRIRIPKVEKDREFRQLTYSIWAANELISRLRDDCGMPPLTVIEDFTYEMDSYSMINIDTSFIFSVGFDTAMDIYDHLLLLFTGDVKGDNYE